MKNILLSLMVFGIGGCSEVNLVDIANTERFIKLSDIYDCRSQRRHPWGDSSHSQVSAFLIDIKNKRALMHVGYYKNTILDSAFEYELKTSMSDNYEFEQIFFDVDNIREASTFLRFTLLTKESKSSDFVIDKVNNSLSPIIKKNKALKEKISDMAGIGISEEWVLKNTGLSWEDDCIKI